MRVKIRFSRIALADVEEIYSYTRRQWGDDQADRYVDEIWETLEKIGANPERWRLREELHPGCRICFAGRHAILYRIHEERVEIARVLHGAMDLKQHIPPGFMQDE